MSDTTTKTKIHYLFFYTNIFTCQLKEMNIFTKKQNINISRKSINITKIIHVLVLDSSLFLRKKQQRTSQTSQATSCNKLTRPQKIKAEVEIVLE